MLYVKLVEEGWKEAEENVNLPKEPNYLDYENKSVLCQVPLHPLSVL